MVFLTNILQYIYIPFVHWIHQFVRFQTLIILTIILKRCRYKKVTISNDSCIYFLKHESGRYPKISVPPFNGNECFFLHQSKFWLTVYTNTNSLFLMYQMKAIYIYNLIKLTKTSFVTVYNVFNFPSRSVNQKE